MVSNEISKLELIQARISFIPEGWKLDKVGEALNIKNNFRKPISQEVRSLIPGPYPYYGPTKIQDHIADYEQDGIYALIGEDGDHFLKYETMRQTQFISGKCTVNNHAHIIESSDTCDSEWFYIYFQYRNITNFLSRQGAGRFKLNKATLEKLPLLVPPLPEQQKIAKILSTWDQAISTTERLIGNSTQQKKALMQQLLTGKKRLLDESGKRFDGEWEVYKLSKICSINKGKQINRSTLSDTGAYPVINGGITPSGYTESSNTQANTITISEGGNSCGFVGFQNEAFWCGGHCYALQNVKTNNLFLYQFLKFIERKIMALRVGSGLPNIQKKEIEIVEILVPTHEEQQKIATVLINADQEIDLLKQQLADLQQEKKALMQVLLTGKKRVVV